NSRNRLSGGFTLQTRDSQNAQLLGFVDELDGRGYSVDLGWTFTIAPRKIHDFRVRLNRDRNRTLPWFAGRENTADLLGIIGPSTNNPVNWGPPNLSFTNFGGLTDGAPVLRRNQTISITDSVSVIRG